MALLPALAYGFATTFRMRDLVRCFAGATVREVLTQVGDRFPALRARIFDDGNIAAFVNVYVGGEDIRTQDGLETPVADGSTVILLPAMAGGVGR